MKHGFSRILSRGRVVQGPAGREVSGPDPFGCGTGQGRASGHPAFQEVAQLEYELAEKTLQATQTRIDAGTANLHDLDDARSQLSERFISLQDVTFELQRAQLGLMRTTGDLEKWALGQ